MPGAALGAPSSPSARPVSGRSQQPQWRDRVAGYWLGAPDWNPGACGDWTRREQAPESAPCSLWNPDIWSWQVRPQVTSSSMSTSLSAGRSTSKSTCVQLARLAMSSRPVVSSNHLQHPNVAINPPHHWVRAARLQSIHTSTNAHDDAVFVLNDRDHLSPFPDDSITNVRAW